MATDIDELQIHITSEASGASKSLNNLVKKFEKLSIALNAVDATKVNSILTGFKVIGSIGNATAKGIDIASKSATKTAKSFDGLVASLGKYYATFALLTRGTKSVWKNIESSMDYVETSNYFSVALDQIGQKFEEAGYETADLYTEALSSELNKLNKLNEKLTGYSLGASGEALFSGDVGLGMDIEQMMNFQAKTLAVTNSVGLMGEASLQTAKAVSMLSGDLSSLTNTDLESVMTNLSSGLIGQSRALYKYGIDITQNTLQQYALAEGIEKSVAEMTQAEKMQLRLLAILDQSTVAQTDLANTINSVANQYRVFEQQTDNLGRTIGNLFLPIVQNVLPYVNGLIIALNNLFTTLGFNLYGDTWLEDLQQGISGGTIPDDFDEIGESADSATESINAFKKGIRGFDELNVLTGSTRVGSGVVSELEGQIDLTDSITKAVADYENAWDEAFSTAKNKAGEFAKDIQENLEDIMGVFYNFDEDRATIFTDVLGGLAVSLVTIKGITEAPGIIDSIANALDNAADVVTGTEKFNVSLAGLETAGQNLIKALGAGTFTKALAMSGLIGVSATMLKIYFDLSNAVYDGSSVEAANGRISTAVDELIGIKGRLEENFVGIDLDTSSAKKAVEEYFDLLSTDTVPDDKKLATLQNYVQYIIDKFPELGSKVDANTGLFTANKEAILANIDALSGYAKQMAAQDILTEAYKKLYDAQARYAEYEDAYNQLRRKGQLDIRLFRSTDFQSDMYETKKNLDEYGEILAQAELYVKRIEGIAGGNAETTLIDVPIIPDDITKRFEEATKAGEEFGKASGQISEVIAEETENVKLIDEVMKLYVPGLGFVSESTKKLEEGTERLNSDFEKMSGIIPNLNEKFGLSSEAVEDISSVMKNLADGIDNLNKKSINIPLNIGGGNLKFEPIAVDFFNVKGYASGGIVSSGEVFIARENGMPEMVGSFGNHTAVANNIQITDAIRQAAYEGFKMAIAESGGNSGGDIVVNIEGKEVFRAVQKEEQSIYNRTGNSVFVH